MPSSSHSYYEESLVVVVSAPRRGSSSSPPSSPSTTPRRKEQQQQQQQQKCGDGCYRVQIESVQRSWWWLLDHHPRPRPPRRTGGPPQPQSQSRRAADRSDSDGSSDNDFLLRVVQSLLKRHKASRISIQYRNQAASSSTSTSSNGAGPSGMSVQVDFPLRHHDLRQEESDERPMMGGRHQDDDDDDDAFNSKMRHILAELHDRRILVAPILGAGTGGRGRGRSVSDDPTYRHTSRLHPRPFLVTTAASGGNSSSSINGSDSVVVTYTYHLPTDGSMASSEGVSSFLQLLPCGNDAGLWSLASNEDWSHVLLGTAIDSTRRRTSGGGGEDDDHPMIMYPLASHMPRRMWIEAKLDSPPSTDDDDDDDSMITASCPTEFNASSLEWAGVSLSTGIEYTLMKPNNNDNDDGSVPPSLRSLLPVSQQIRNDNRFTICQLADATRLVLVNRTAIGAGASSSIVDIGDNESIFLSVPISKLFDQGMDRDGTVTRIQEMDVPSGRAASWHLDYTVQRTSGQAHRGTIRASLTSYGGTCPTVATLHHVLPQILSPVWQSLRVEMYNTTESSSSASSHFTILHWKDLDWTDDVRMDDHDGTIRWSFRHMLPPNSTMVMTLDYEASFLNFEEFPPDPNRGFELPPVVAQLSTPASCVDGSASELNASEGRHMFTTTTTLYSDSPLLMSPVPDMSMPFNVISLTCTWYAFVIGSLIHLLYRKGSERIKYQLHPELRPKPPLQKIKDKIKAKWAQVRASRATPAAITTTTQAENDDATARSVSATTTPAEEKSQE